MSAESSYYALQTGILIERCRIVKDLRESAVHWMIGYDSVEPSTESSRLVAAELAWRADKYENGEW